MARLSSTLLSFDPGGGPFAVDQLTLGIFLDDQPDHRIAIGGDRRAERPLTRHQGWIMPAGATGICEFDRPLSVRMVTLERALLSEVGLADPAAVRPIIGAIDPMLLQMALAAERFMAGQALYRETMIRALAAEIARVAGAGARAGAEPGDEPGGTVADIRLRRVVECIEDDPAADHSLETLAGLAAMSPYHFARAFKAATGSPPLHYVIAARMRLAEMLLKGSSLPVTEIAWRVGYGDTSRFIRSFRRHAGVTPGAFRAG
ncbi:MAG: AraC family transcriptional regulator [Pseudomonadota bacterium]